MMPNSESVGPPSFGMSITLRPDTWLHATATGLYCEPGGFYIDPRGPVERAVITHGHSDHARPGHGAVLATSETIEMMRVRMGQNVGAQLEVLAYGKEKRIGDVIVRFAPAGHILGSAQIVLEHQGQRAVVSGDYKRRRDPTASPFELVSCDLFVTEATFGLPVFQHEPETAEIAKLLASLRAFPERAHVVGVYPLGKCQRFIMLLRQAGYDRPIWLHGGLVAFCALYLRHGIPLGDLRLVAEEPQSNFSGEIVLCPPSALADRWSRRMADPVTAFASGWMRVRARARQRGVELPLIISDHADWPELVQTIAESAADEIWVTHGRDDALVHQIGLMGKRGRALAMVGYEEEAE
jgi:putative mRNA 3-end processing factor